jgi:hypothetical protein
MNTTFFPSRIGQIVRVIHGPHRRLRGRVVDEPGGGYLTIKPADGGALINVAQIDTRIDTPTAPTTQRRTSR